MSDPSTPLAYEDFVAWYPEFANISPGAVERQLDLANMTVAQSAWGKWWRQAVGLFTAHYLAIRFNISEALFVAGVRSPTASVGTVTNKSANTSGISEGTAVSGLVTGDDPISADFARTSYGLEYLSLMAVVIPPGDVVISPSVSASTMGGVRRI